MFLDICERQNVRHGSPFSRLLAVSAEDVWGLITSEIKPLHHSYVFVNKTVPAKQPRGASSSRKR